MVMLSSTMRGRVIKFHSPALPPNTLLLASLEGREKISHPYSFQVGFVSKKADIDFAAVLRKPVSVGIKVGVALAGGQGRGIQTVRLNGILSHFEQADKGGEWVIYEATLVPRLWRLSLNFHTRIFLDKSIPEIVEQVLKENDLAPEDYEFQAKSRGYGKREYVVQYQESDLNFISRWLEHEGIFYFFRQEDDRERIVFADSPTAFEPIPGEEALPYRPAGQRGEAEGIGQRDWYEPDSIHTFRCRCALTSKEVVLQDYNWRTPAIDLKASALVSVDGHGTRYEFGDHYRDPEEGKLLAKIRAEERQCRQRIFCGVGDGKSFHAGGIFSLSEHYRADFNARYLITEVTHKATQAMSLTGGAKTTAMYENEFVCIPADAPFRPERTTPKPRIPGTINARVDGAMDGKYGELDEHGRYKVRMPFDLSGRGDGHASRAVRMTQPYGGNEYGIHLPLHKGIEVALTHVNGDPDRPVISGAVPNPATKSPVVDANSTQAILKSAGNNAILFDDMEGEELVFIHAQKNHQLRAKHDVVEWVGNARHLTVQGDQIERVGGNRHEKIVKDERREIGGMRHLTIAHDELRDIGGNASCVVDGDAVLEVHGSQSASVGGDSVVEAETIVLRAKSGITLECGGNCIVIDSSGVTVHGMAVTIDGSQTKINSGPGASPRTTQALATAVPELPRGPIAPRESVVAAAAAAGGGGEEAANGQGKETGKSWIGIELKDEKTGKPVPYERFTLKLPGGSIRVGRLGKDGKAKVTRLPKGPYEVGFPRIHKDEWKKA